MGNETGEAHLAPTAAPPITAQKSPCQSPLLGLKLENLLALGEEHGQDARATNQLANLGKSRAA